MPTPSIRIMLLTAPTSYRATAFIHAARKLKLDTVQVVDLPDELAERPHGYEAIDFRNIEDSSDWIVRQHKAEPFAAILSVDDAATELAAVASARLDLPANDPQAAHAARDKHVMRTLMERGGARVPTFELISIDDDFAELATRLDYPVVVKPRTLTGSRGVIRADNEVDFLRAATRSASIVRSSGSGGEAESLLIEQYLPGEEVAVEGILTNGELQILAVFDKPDPLVGPFFEETIYVTPSRLSPHVLDDIATQTQIASHAIGLRHGPIHAELRISDERSWLLEVAGRSIGGL